MLLTPARYFTTYSVPPFAPCLVKQSTANRKSWINGPAVRVRFFNVSRYSSALPRPSRSSRICCLFTIDSHRIAFKIRGSLQLGKHFNTSRKLLRRNMHGKSSQHVGEALDANTTRLLKSPFLFLLRFLLRILLQMRENIIASIYRIYYTIYSIWLVARRM